MTIPQALALALQHHQSGRLPEAEAIYRQILAVEPHHSGALHLLGVVAHQVGRHEVAVEFIRQAIALTPTIADFHSNLGEACRMLGQLDEAIAAYRQAIALNPSFAGAHSNLGIALSDRGQLDEAITACRQAIALQPTYPEALSNLGNVLQRKGRYDEAITAHRQALALSPAYAEAHSNLGNALRESGALDEAIAAYRQAIALQPDLAEAHYNLGNALIAKEHLDDATTAYRQAITLKPHFPEALNNLGNTQKMKGQLDEAITTFRQAIALQPAHVEAHSNLLFSLRYHPDLDSGVIAAEHRRWNQQHAAPLRKFIQPHPNDRTPERCLRIGYVSPDFREHSVAFFLENLLASHDPAQVEVFCYADLARPDAVTARLREVVPHWREIFALPDAQVAELIREDRIDLLVDLAGHTAGHRLLVFARKPAPVQVSWLGYPGSTGLEAIDYRLTDALADPPDSAAELSSEPLVRLAECAWCYRPSTDAPAVRDPPVLHAAHVTFGCFNALPKITAPMLHLWSRILHAVPGSHLLLKNGSLRDASTRDRLRHGFETLGIAPDRIELANRTLGQAEHLACYGRVDLALDTFPYHGTTTTCEALWMGVPVITLAGNTHCSRVGVSLLTHLGLPELIATSEDHYRQLAATLAADLPRLTHLRHTLRERMQQSPLMAAARFARAIEAAYREMWHQWCARGGGAAAP